MTALNTRRAMIVLLLGLAVNLNFLLGYSRSSQAQLILDVIHDFPRSGEFPVAGLLEASNGMLYGTTQQGGSFNQGTLFRVNKDGTGFSLLRSFQCGVSTNGCIPTAGLIEASDGVPYGTTQQGGSFNQGTAFKINKDGTGFSLLHSFQCTTTNGCVPFAGLIEASDGALYGTTQSGGSFSAGTAFKINKDGTGF